MTDPMTLPGVSAERPTSAEVLGYLKTMDATAATAQIIAYHLDVETRDVSRVLLALETVGDVVRIKEASRLFWKAAE